MAAMPKYFSKAVDRYFDQWIRVFTWDTMHPYDMERFYQFLKALKKYSRKYWAKGFHENIVKAAKDYHPNLDEKHITEMANFFIKKAETCFAYEEAPFPDPLVEKTDPYAVRSRLSRIQVLDDKGNTRPLYTSDEIEDILAKDFGKD
jgi:hypothetical protein